MIIKRNYILGFILFALLVSKVYAQQYNPDSTLHLAGDREKLAALQQMAAAARNNNPQQALIYLDQAIEKARVLNDIGALARCFQLSGSIHYRNGNFQRAKEVFLESLNNYIVIRDNKGQAEVTAALAGIYYAGGNLPMAADHYLRSLRYYEEINDKAGMVNMLGALGSIYARQNNFSKSIEYSLRAISLYEESSDKMRALTGYDNIGNIYLRQHNPQKAQEYFLKSLVLYKEMDNNAGIASTLLQLGNIEHVLGNNDRAIAYYKRSLVICNTLKAKPLIVSNLNAMGKAYMELRLYDQAIHHYQQAIKTAKGVHLKMELEEAYQGLAQVYKLTREQEKATTFSALSKELKDSIYNDSNLKKLTDQMLVYESEKKQQQIELLSKEQQIKDSELLRERQIRNVFSIAGILLGIILIILIIFSFQKRAIAKSLQKQKTELEAKNRSVQEQKEKLDQLNTVKDRFFSIISHDLRNNLTTMKLYFDLISNKDYRPSDHSEITREISGSVENTIDLLENLLVWASTQIKGVTIHIQKLNVHSLSEENISLLSGLAHQKNISLLNKVPEDITAYGDIDMINLVLRNLISNAVKFTDTRGVILVSSEMREDECIICVRDNGVGIREEDLLRLFDQHTHPSTKGTANEKGTGLGLMLCKDFVEKNNGRIWVESEKGKGSTFFFTLPATSSPKPHA